MSHETIRLGHSTSFVELRCAEVGKAPGMSGDLKLEIAVSYNGFSGRYDEVWIAAHEWAAFIGALTQIEREHRGRASVRAMSPEEFELQLEVAHGDAWATAHGYLSKYVIGFPTGTVQSRIYFSAAVGPSTWTEVVPSLITLGRAAV
jgi:hypothetical protein